MSHRRVDLDRILPLPQGWEVQAGAKCILENGRVHPVKEWLLASDGPEEIAQELGKIRCDKERVTAKRFKGYLAGINEETTFGRKRYSADVTFVEQATADCRECNREVLETEIDCRTMLCACCQG